MLPPLLPTEVIDYILSLLQLDFASLKACTRAHPVLSKLVQLHFFADIVLHDEKYVVNVDENGFRSFELTAILSSCPNIVHYVQNLKICIDHATPPPDRALELEEFSSIMAKFSRLKQVSLVITGGGVCSWQVLPEIFCLTFMNCLRLRSVAELYIGYVSDFPLYSLDNREIALKRLTLWGCCRAIWPGSVVISPNLPMPRLHWERCDEEAFDSCLTWLIIGVRKQAEVSSDPHS